MTDRFLLKNAYSEKIIIFLKSFSTNKTRREIIWLMVGQSISIALGFVTMKLLSTMGTSEFGKYSLVLTIAAFVSAILYGPVEQGFIRFYYEYLNKGKARTFIHIFYGFLLTTGISLLIITIPLLYFINYIINIDKKILGLLIMGLYVIIFTSSNIYNSFLNILRKRKANTLIQIAEKSLIILLLYLVTFKTKLTADLGLLVILIALLIIIILKTNYLNTYVPKDINANETQKTRREIVHVIARFSWPFAIWGITGWLQSNSERWIIAKYLSTGDVGIFSLMAVLANYLIAIPSGIISQFTQPIIYEKISSKSDISEREKGYKVFNYFILATIGIVIISTLFSIIFGDQMILLISNKEFASNWKILPILCVGIGLFTIAQALTTDGVIKNIPKVYIVPKMITGIFAIFANVFFIIHLGILGVALSICLINLLYLLMITFINKKIKYRLK